MARTFMLVLETWSWVPKVQFFPMLAFLEWFRTFFSVCLLFNPTDQISLKWLLADLVFF